MYLLYDGTVISVATRTIGHAVLLANTIYYELCILYKYILILKKEGCYMRLLAAEQILCSRTVHMDYAQLSIFLSGEKMNK